MAFDNAHLKASRCMSWPPGQASRPASEAEDGEATVPRQWLFGVICLLTDQCKYSNNFHVDNKVKII